MTGCPQAVLLVEDDEDIREALSMVLEEEGFTVQTASNGEVAIERLKNLARPCIVILDLMMPRVNGWEVMAFIKENDYLVALPVIITSAASDKAPDGAVKIMKKPIDLERLIMEIKKHCRCD